MCLARTLLPCLAAAALLAACGGHHSTSPIRINEVLPSNHMGCADSAGERNDWVELYNTGSADVDLGGYSLTDDTASPRKSVLASGLTVRAGGALLLWADGTTDQGSAHLSFKLGAVGEEVVLYDPDGREVDRFAWTGAVTDVSFARVPDGTGALVRCATPTCGAVNSGSCE